ncbi:SDR family oxidoreductase [Aeromicrobium sp. UC242_57]|uniref:SDR family oxidoreductase n=1 Tax=Aeromicrobium sp. UC242_57 TaxID=3374624 RepID=UPI0037BA39E1
MTDLTGRIALVTGAAGGIGGAISRQLAAAGATVAACDLNESAAKDVAASLGASHRGYAMDISDSKAVTAALSTIESDLGPVDILVNNAGIDKIERFVDSKEDTWRAIVNVNYLGTVIVTRAVLDSMIERRSGRIINISFPMPVGSDPPARWCTQAPRARSSRSARRSHARSPPRASRSTLSARARPTPLSSTRSPS